MLEGDWLQVPGRGSQRLHTGTGRKRFLVVRNGMNAEGYEGRRVKLGVSTGRKGRGDRNTSAP